MSLDPEFVKILRCPSEKTPVRLLGEHELSKLNENRELLRYRDGSSVMEPLKGALVTEDGRTVYRVDGNIPVLFINRGISVPAILRDSVEGVE